MRCGESKIIVTRRKYASSNPDRNGNALQIDEELNDRRRHLSARVRSLVVTRSLPIANCEQSVVVIWDFPALRRSDVHPDSARNEGRLVYERKALLVVVHEFPLRIFTTQSDDPILASPIVLVLLYYTRDETASNPLHLYTKIRQSNIDPDPLACHLF